MPRSCPANAVAPPNVAACPQVSARRILAHMTTKSRQYLFGSSVRAAAERAAKARREADQLACKAWNMRMLGFKGPAQPSPALDDALNAGSATWKSAALAATRIRLSPWIL